MTNENKIIQKVQKLLVAFALVFLISCAQQEPVKIGAVAALSGNLANIGTDERLGLEIAVDEINSAGGINGRPIELVWEDSKCDPKEGTSAATKLSEIDGVKVIMGSTCTGDSMAIAKIANSKKLILMSSVMSGSVYSNTGDYTFRTIPSDNAKDLVDHLFSKGYRKFGMINELTDFSQSLRNDFKKWVLEKGGQIVADENFDSKETDFRTMLVKMKDAKPDAYLINTNSAPVGVLVARQAKVFNLAPLYGTRGFETAKPGESAAELEGIVFYGISGAVNLNTTDAKRLFDEYERRAGNRNFKAFAVASRYDGVKVVAKAMEACGEDTDCIKDWLYSMPAYDGVSGTFSFDRNGDPVGIKYAFSTFRNGRIVPLKEG